jgi:anionic cell wall polymer biosynthesis LytR-Cps2A-Psr (LCP) family protein
VDLCSPRPIVDHKAGLRLPAGPSRLDGETSLAFVRARYFDGRGDLGRMERQQQFLGAVVQRITSSGVLLNPARLTGFVGAALDAVQADADLTHEDLLGLAQRLRNLSARRVQFARVPVADPDYRPGGLGSTVRWDAKASAALFASIRDDAPLAARGPGHGSRPGGASTSDPSPRTVARGDDLVGATAADDPCR